MWYESVNFGAEKEPGLTSEREFLIDNLLVRIHSIIVMIRWSGLAQWELNSLFQVALHVPS